MKKLLLLVASTLLVSVSYSQFSYKEKVDYHIEITEGMPKAQEGTFQFVILQPKVEPAFETDILFFIERERKENEDVTISISEFVDLYIPSRSTVSSNNFVPLETYKKR
jgi:hypothetical protein